MTTIERSIEIARPVEAVFAFTHDPANDAMWQPTIAESRVLTEGPMRVGTRIAEVRRFLGRRIEATYEVTELEPNRRSSIKTTSGPIPLTGSYVLEPVDGRTRFTMRLETDAHGFFKLAEPVFARMARREMESNLGHLKDLLESREAAREQDGA
jgi:hypothetical protein